MIKFITISFRRFPCKMYLTTKRFDAQSIFIYVDKLTWKLCFILNFPVVVIVVLSVKGAASDESSFNVSKTRVESPSLNRIIYPM